MTTVVSFGSFKDIPLPPMDRNVFWNRILDLLNEQHSEDMTSCKIKQWIDQNPFIWKGLKKSDLIDEKFEELVKSADDPNKVLLLGKVLMQNGLRSESAYLCCHGILIATRDYTSAYDIFNSRPEYFERLAALEPSCPKIGYLTEISYRFYRFIQIQLHLYHSLTKSGNDQEANEFLKSKPYLSIAGKFEFFDCNSIFFNANPQEIQQCWNRYALSLIKIGYYHEVRAIIDLPQIKEGPDYQTILALLEKD